MPDARLRRSKAGDGEYVERPRRQLRWQMNAVNNCLKYLRNLGKGPYDLGREYKTNKKYYTKTLTLQNAPIIKPSPCCIHQIVNDRIEHRIGHRQPVEGEIYVLNVFTVEYFWIIVLIQEENLLWQPAYREQHHNHDEHADYLMGSFFSL